MNSHAAVGHLSANEAGSDNGVSLTRGAERLAREDAERMAWLNAQAVTWREEVEAHHRAMGIRPKKRGWRARKVGARSPRFR